MLKSNDQEYYRFVFGLSHPIMSSHTAKASIVVLDLRLVPVAVGTTAVLRPVVPGAAPQDTLLLYCIKSLLQPDNTPVFILYF